MLAKVVNDDAINLVHCGALRFFASKLAPTGRIILMSLWRLPSWPTNSIPVPTRKFTSRVCPWTPLAVPRKERR
ncbi:hypothetical protein FJD34_07950 [Pseudomonas brenneri]|uniref:Uncharacterized protein n=1 Tax=Pseudomonas brenneri TaxID=129817 RepID=A0A5B2UYZ0_9PSED|nr:hypothetical protein F1720_09660 [Pseudomonas brenneri]TWR80205.1 hypothetical protein FJD34_07950 [Pseudomonas brenneri]